MIIDSHCHAGKGDGLTGPWDTDAPLGAYLRRAAHAGIGRTVLFAAFNSDYRAANAGVGQIVAMRPDRLYGYAMVHAARDAGRIGAIVGEAVTSWGACGIKMHKHDARISREVCEVARSFALPVLYDVMGEAYPMELVAEEYPDVAFVLPHLGSFAGDWRVHRAVIDLLARHPNIYTDTSGVREFDLLAEAVRRAGPQKVLFGTDGPRLHPGVELCKVYALGLPPAQENLVLAANWLRLTAAARSRTRAQAWRKPVSATRIPLTRSTAAARLLRPGRLPSPTPELMGDRGDPWAADQFPADQLSYSRAQR
jgi:predicted TIM-barrel fold metal-dependent hydrolase